MLAYFTRVIIFTIVTLTALPLSADWLCDFCNSVARDTKRRNCWPAPFVCPDRQTVREPFAIEVNNGWRRQNMLGDFYFEPTTGQLTEAGKLKIRWIVFEAPEQHREIYVHIGKTGEETQARLAFVTAEAGSLAPQGQVPPIMQTSISDGGSPADRVDMIERKYQSSTPIPRMPAPTGQGGSGSSSGAMGGSGP
ncbi:MAG: hypothetical protein ABSG67_15670 [Thermoguttaceae bacterium]|jgi:hypothetical protein